MISRQPLVLAVPTGSALRSLADLVARGRADDTLTAGNSGVGTLSHLTTELINQKLGTRLTEVPYRGDAALLPDVVGGTVAMGVFNLPVALPLIIGGKLRAIAVTSAQPVAALPKVPTLASAGGDEFVIDGWAALFAARNVPLAGVERLDKLLQEALSVADVRERFERFGVVPAPAGRRSLRDFMQAESARWTGLIRSRGIKLD
jgi:tripartite-type tricarboxylate transporter receptor subunit TctC